MSLETTLKEFVRAVVAEVLSATPAKTEAKKESKPAKTETPKESAPAAPAVDRKVFNKAFTDLMTHKGRAAGVRVLEQFKAERASLIKDADLFAAMEAVKKEASTSELSDSDSLV